jgi:hypothetical protein
LRKPFLTKYNCVITRLKPILLASKTRRGMGSTLKKRLHKLVAASSLFASLLIQTMMPTAVLVFTAVEPAFAASLIDTPPGVSSSTFEWNAANNEFELSVTNVTSVDVTLTYTAAGLATEQGLTVSGAANGSNVFSKHLYAGTSSNGANVPHQVEKGTLILEMDTLSSGAVTKEFTFKVENNAIVLTDGDFEIVGEDEYHVDQVELSHTYEFPASPSGTLTFTELPTPAGSLDLKEIELDPELVDDLNAFENKAWEITSDMEDGEFTYDLTLPKPANVDEGDEVVITYGDDLEDLESDPKTIEAVVEGDKVKASGLDHFTIFVITAPPGTPAELWWYAVGQNLGPDDAVPGSLPGWQASVVGTSGTQLLNSADLNTYPDAGVNKLVLDEGAYTLEEVVQPGYQFTWGRCTDMTDGLPSGWGDYDDVSDEIGVQQTWGPQAPNTTGGSTPQPVNVSSNQTQAELEIDAGQRIYCVLHNEPVVTQTADVQLCKEDTQGNPLSGWQLVLRGQNAVYGPTDVPVTENSSLSTGTLPAGSYVNYLSGTFQYWPNALPDAGIADAGYSLRPVESVANPNTFNPNPAPQWMDSVGFPGAFENYLKVRVDGSLTAWGPFNSEHLYATGSTLNVSDDITFNITDDQYHDNFNNAASAADRLRATVYEGYIATTGVSGCVDFTDVPHGTYVAEELPQDGWENVSGQGQTVTVSGNTTVEFVNEQQNQQQVPLDAPVFWVEEDTAHTLIHWTDVANETGYRIYRDGAFVASVFADQTGYTDLTGGDHLFEVRAYTASSESAPQQPKRAQTFQVVIDDNAMIGDFVDGSAGGSGSFTHTFGSAQRYGTQVPATQLVPSVLQNAVGGDNYSADAVYAGETATWTASAALNGRYEIFVNYICDPSRGVAHYNLFSGSTKLNAGEIQVDQATTTGHLGDAACAGQASVSVAGPQWVSIGVYPFDGSGPARLELVDASANGTSGTEQYILADAVAFNPVETTDVMVCKEDQSGTPLAGWSLMLRGAQVDGPREIGVMSDTPVESALLPAGYYLNLITGTYLYWPNSQPTAGLADAAFTLRPVENPPSAPNTFNPNLSPTWMDSAGFPGAFQNYLKMEVNGTTPSWGAFNSGHTYAAGTALGGANTFKYNLNFDDVWQDNSNADANAASRLSATTYHGYAGITNVDGCVTFDNVRVGEQYEFDEIMQDGWSNGAIPAEYRPRTVTIATVGDNVTTGNLFVLRNQSPVLPSGIAGAVWSDANQNGSQDVGELTVGGWTVFIDQNSNGTLELGEQNTVTNGTGEYNLGNLTAGTYRVCQVLQVGWNKTWPLADCHDGIVLGASQTLLGYNFGNFQAVVTPSPTPNPTPSPTPSSSGAPSSTSNGGGGSSGGGGGGGSASAPVCSASTPGTPSNLRIVASSANTVTLAWNTPSGSITHYALNFGVSPNTSQYGAAQIGDSTTVTYTINGISGGQNYTFQLRGVNGCQPGEAATVSTAVGGGVLTTRPTGTGGQVLGVSTGGSAIDDATPSATVSPAPTAPITPQVLGDGVCEDNPFWWLGVVMYVVIMLVSTFALTNKSQFRWLAEFLGTFGSAVAFYVTLCQPWPWIIGVVIITVIIELLVKFFLQDDEEDVASVPANDETTS